MTPTIMKLDLPLSYRVLLFGVMLLMTIIAIALLVTTLGGGSEAGPPVAVIVVWCGFMAWNWYFLLGIPYRIELNGPEEIVFISLRKTVRTSAASIKSVKTSGNNIYVLRYDGGKIRLVQQFTGFYKLLAIIEAANPLFETRGIRLRDLRASA